MKNESSLHDVLLWLKCVAVDPCKPEVCSGKAGFIARKVLIARNREFHKRKRKYALLKQETSKATSKLPPQKSKQQSFAELSEGQCTFSNSTPSLISYTVSEESSELTLQTPLQFCNNILRKCIPKGPSPQANAMDQSNPPDKEYLIVLDYDDSDCGSNALVSKKEGSQTPNKRSRSPVEQMLNLPAIQPDLAGGGSPSMEEVSPLLCSDVSSSNVSGPMKPQKHQTLQKVIGLRSLIGDKYPRLPIPIGPRFQVEVPDWTSPPKMNNSSDPRLPIPVGPRFQVDIPDWPGLPKMNSLSDGDGDSDLGNSKWLGTKIWPIEGIETSTEMIRQERHHSCSCESPGSTECIKHHVAGEILRLQSELGPAFYSWKFDQMGEEVSKSWTMEEQKSFEDLVNKNPMSNTKAFWRTAFKCFPGKHREHIVSYYFNVHVLRRISRQTRLVCAIVDTDDDEADGSDNKSKNSGNQYLTHLR